MTDRYKTRETTKEESKDWTLVITRGVKSRTKQREEICHERGIGTKVKGAKVSECQLTSYFHNLSFEVFIKCLNFNQKFKVSDYDVVLRIQ